MKSTAPVALKFFLIGFMAFALNINQISAQTSQTPPDDLKDPLSSTKKSFVLLELFTSEGCPTCPPADANLAFLEKEQPFADTEIVTLALHVDYWNSVTWKDIYSSPIFSRRQQLYSQALKIGQSYTPQMIVDGQTEFTGNNMAKAQKAILKATKIPKATIDISLAADKLKIKINNAPPHENATIFLAVTEDNLVSNRKSKANTAKSPNHTSVLRKLAPLGILTAEQTNLELETTWQIQPEWKNENLKIIVFVQENKSRKIFGATKAVLD